MEQQRGQADARRGGRAWIKALAAVERDEVKVGFSSSSSPAPVQHQPSTSTTKARQGKTGVGRGTHIGRWTGLWGGLWVLGRCGGGDAK
jgi:hypothetical protein